MYMHLLGVGMLLDQIYPLEKLTLIYRSYLLCTPYICELDYSVAGGSN
jgi:hypothetical protein